MICTYYRKYQKIQEVSQATTVWMQTMKNPWPKKICASWCLNSWERSTPHLVGGQSVKGSARAKHKSDRKITMSWKTNRLRNVKWFWWDRIDTRRTSNSLLHRNVFENTSRRCLGMKKMRTSQNITLLTLRLSKRSKKTGDLDLISQIFISIWPGDWLKNGTRKHLNWFRSTFALEIVRIGTSRQDLIVILSTWYKIVSNVSGTSGRGLRCGLTLTVM